MVIEVEKANVYQPSRFHNGREINAAAAIIEKQANDNLMMHHSKRELKRAARRGQLMLLRDGEGQVKGVVEISAKHRTLPIFKNFGIGRVKAAELGALAIDSEYQGNGFGTRLVQSLAEHYLREGFLQRFFQRPDIILFAMAGTNNPVSNKTFKSLNGVLIDQRLLPKEARGEGYNAYAITHLGRRGQ